MMEKSQTETWTVDEEDAGERLDKYLSAIYDEYSRVMIQRLIQEGSVTLERKGSVISTSKTSEKLCENPVPSSTFGKG